MIFRKFATVLDESSSIGRVGSLVSLPGSGCDSPPPVPFAFSIE
jgi:hypothetical protein